MVFPSFKPRASMDMDRPRFSLSFGSRHEGAEAAPLDKGKDRQKEETNDAAFEEALEVPQTEGQIEGEPETEASETKSRLSKSLHKLRNCCRTRRCLVNSKTEEDRSPIPGSRSKKRRFPYFAASTTNLFREPIVGSQVIHQENPDYDHRDDDDGQKPLGETMHLKDHREELLAGTHERLRRNSWPPHQGLAPPPPRPRVEMLPAQLPTSPNADSISSSSGSGSSGGTPALSGLGISLNTGSGTFGVDTGSPMSPASPNSPMSPASPKSPSFPAATQTSVMQQPPTPMDAAEDELVYCGLAALWAEESERMEAREEDAESDWHELLCV